MFRSERLTGALLDRLTHHVHILELNGESHRLRQSKGWRPVAEVAAQIRATAVLAEERSLPPRRDPKLTLAVTRPPADHPIVDARGRGADRRPFRAYSRVEDDVA